MTPKISVAPIVESGAALQIQGRELLTAFYATAQSLKLYPLENATVQKSLAELHVVAQRITDREGMIELQLIGDFIFLNDARLRLDLSNYVAFSFLAGAMARHGIGVISVAPGVDRNEWAPFISLLLNEEAPEDPFSRFERRLQQSPITHITVDAESRKAPVPEQEDLAKQAAKRTYFQGVNVAREVLTDVRLGRAVNVRRVKRTVQSIVDQVLNNESAIVGMTNLRDYDEYTFTHSVNVCILSVVIGQRLGLSKLQLYELGVGALFHDIGKMRIDPAITNKPGSLTDEEFEAIKEHPTEGLLQLFSIRGFAEMPYRAMLVAYEHHMKVDQTGYPRSKRPREVTLFSRIVAVADGFDAATSKRSYQPFPATPDMVIREMQDNPERGYDQTIVKALVSATGIYPVGTIVVLDTFEIGVVVEPSRDSKTMGQPKVKIITDRVGLHLSEPIIVDLAEVDPETGKPLRTIIKTLDSEKVGIRVGDFFI